MKYNNLCVKCCHFIILVSSPADSLLCVVFNFDILFRKLIPHRLQGGVVLGQHPTCIELLFICKIHAAPLPRELLNTTVLIQRLQKCTSV